MKKITLLLAALALFSFSAKAQGHDIKFTLKGCKDTMAFLVKYQWDQRLIADTCKNIKNGLIEFKGKETLDKGVYVIVSQSKTTYFDSFFINESQKFSLSSDVDDITVNLKAIDSKENELYFSYYKYIVSKNVDYGNILKKATGKGKKDSTEYVAQKVKELNEEVKKYDADFMAKAKGTFVYDVFNLKTEKEATTVPKASNGRPDSIYQYNYYKAHYWDGVNFKDERIIRNQFFEPRVKKYFDNVIVVHPDTAIVEIDRMLAKCEPDNLVYNILLSYFAYKYEQSKMMGFDKVFVHIADKYVATGKASKVYTDEETRKKIKDRADIMRNLVLEAKVSDLFMIDTTDAKVVRKMGFDTASSSKSITDLYYKHVDKLTPMFKTLYSVNAKYTILIFWAADCGHCKTEVPKLNEELKTIKGKIDYKVFAVETKDDIYDMWRKFIIENKLNDFIHVYDPVHINNLKERFDIYSTPVIYILDKDKRIKAKRLGAEQVVDFLKNMERIDKMEKEKEKK